MNKPKPVLKSKAGIIAEPDNPRHYEHGLSDKVPLTGFYGRGGEIDAWRWDIHYDLELGVLCRGHMERCWPAHRRALQLGDIWLTSVWEPHGRFSRDTRRESMHFFVWPQWLAGLRLPGLADVHWLDFFLRPPKQRPRLSAAQRATALRIVGRLPEPLANGAMNKSPALFPVFVDLLLLLNAAQGSQPMPAPQPWPYCRINPAVKMALEKRRFVTADEAAKACLLSRTVFDHAFRRVLGVSFTQFALRQRIAGAMEQIRATNDSLKTIASAWGFADSSHLHGLFVRHHGLTPSVYRKQHA
jgi:AraC-like DNA-binding protein